MVKTKFPVKREAGEAKESKSSKEKGTQKIKVVGRGIIQNLNKDLDQESGKTNSS